MDKLDKLIRLTGTYNIMSDVQKVMTTPKMRKTLVEINQSQLFDKGETATDKKLRTFSAPTGFAYAWRTIQAKARKGLPVDRVTLYHFGKFYKTFKVQVKKYYSLIIADFKKGDMNIGDNVDVSEVLGIQKSNYQKFLNPLQIGLTLSIRKYLKI